MIYVWLSEYTLNTAAKVYHDGGKFNVDVNAWDKNVSTLYKIKETHQDES